MEILIGLTLVGILWLVSPPKWKRWVRGPLLAIALLFLTLSPPGLGLLTWGLTATLPQDSGAALDAVVLLGRGEQVREYRVTVVNNLWAAKRAPRIFVSGRIDAVPAVRLLKSLGVPGSSLGGEECSLTTDENAQFTAAILQPQRVQRILLVTDQPHMWRSLLVFQSAGFQVVPHPLPLPKKISPGAHLMILLREYAGLVAYAVQGRYSPPTAADRDQVLTKLQSWRCEVSGTKESPL